MTARYFDLRSTVLVVAGHGILAEEEDRWRRTVCFAVGGAAAPAFEESTRSVIYRRPRGGMFV